MPPMSTKRTVEFAGAPVNFGELLVRIRRAEGLSREAFAHASNTELKPVKLTDTMAFMFETRFPQRVTEYAATGWHAPEDLSQGLFL